MMPDLPAQDTDGAEVEVRVLLSQEDAERLRSGLYRLEVRPIEAKPAKSELTA